MSKIKSKLLIIVVAFIVVIGAGYGVAQYLGGKPSEAPIVGMPVGEQKIITVEGEIVCLSGKSGRNSLECAIGLLGEDGNYYALKNLSQDKLMEGEYPTGKQIVVSGDFSTSENKTSKYNVVGTIKITEIKERDKTKNSENNNLPQEIFKHWVQSYEKDFRVFRPSDYNFPPSRRPREEFEIKKDGKFVLYEKSLQPDDGVITTKLFGSWKVIEQNKKTGLLEISISKPLHYQIKIISYDISNNDILKIVK